MIDPPERRRSEGRFGGLRQLRGIGGVGTRDGAARASLRGERGCAGEPVARETVYYTAVHTNGASSRKCAQ